MYRFAFCVSGNACDAEDLTQETFLRAWDRLDSFRPGSAMKSWLLTIAANAWRDARRRRGRIAFAPLDREPVGDDPGPDRLLEADERAEILTTAMERLSERTRMVFHLRVQEDLSFRDIASAVGTTEQGARWHMHRARAELMKALAGRT